MLESATPIVQVPSASPRAVKPRVWTVFGACGVAVATAVAVSLAVVGAFAALDQGLSPSALGRLPGVALARILVDELRHPSIFLVVKAAGTAVFGAAALVFGLLGRDRVRDRFRLRRVSAAWGLFASLGVLALGDVLDTLIRAYQLDRLSVQLPKAGFVMEQLSGPLLVAGVVALALLPALCEELFFRGYVLSRLVRRWGPLAGIVVAAALYGVAQLDLIQGTEAFLMGLGLGWLTWRTGSIWPAVLGHALRSSFVVLDSAGALKLGLPVHWRFAAMLVLATSACVLLLPDSDQPDSRAV